MKDYYEILGVYRNASAEEIQKKYRDLARKYHPDVYKGSDAEEVFKDINEAYAILSDSLKRADYDQELAGVVRQKAGEQAAGQSGAYEKAAAQKPTAAMYIAAFARTFFVGAVGALFGALLEFILWFFSKGQGFSPIILYPGTLWGALVGCLLGADMNFNVESFLGPGYLGRTYTFIRTFFYALSFAYFGGRLFIVFPQKTTWAAPLGILLGLIIGATFGSDGEGMLKIRSKEGRFNLLYTGLRAIEVGLIGLVMGTVFGFVAQALIPGFIIFWASFLGFSLGTIVGAIAPANLAAYASYASAAVKNIIVILMVAGAALIGIIFSYIFHDQLQQFLKVFIK